MYGRVTSSKFLLSSIGFLKFKIQKCKIQKNFRFSLPTGRIRSLIEDTKSTILFRIFYEKLGADNKCRFTKNYNTYSRNRRVCIRQAIVQPLSENAVLSSKKSSFQ